MLISDKHNIIFVHIPKTGGTSIKEILKFECKINNLYGNKHLTIDGIIKIIGEDKHHKYNKISVVRNPFDRFVSEYFYRRQTTWKKQPNVTFEQFVNTAYNYLKYNKKDDVINNDAFPLDILDHLRQQHEFIGDYKDISIFRFENLNNDFADYFKKLGHNFKLPRTNSTKHNNYRDYYNEETKAKIQEIYSKDLELFNYTFD